MRLRGKNVILTGASRGIGKIVAQKLDAEGACLALIARNKKKLEETLTLLSNKRSFYYVCDISDEVAVRKIFSEISKKFNKKIDVLINNAGVQYPIGLFVDNELSVWKDNIKINLFGTINCIKSILPEMIGKKYGKIINLSGGGSTSPRPNFSAYGVSKTAIVRFTETLAEELKKMNIDVNAVAPGAINTSMIKEIIDSEKKAGKEYEEAVIRQKNGGNNPRHVAELITFLSSSLSDGITGKLISAIWDPWRDSEFQNLLKNDINVSTLRRIDNKYFKGIK